MQLFHNKKMSKWFFFFSILCTISFAVSGIESGEGSQPTADSNPVLDTIYIISSPFMLSFVYYHLYKRVNIWLVFLSTPILGIIMEWLLFKPADVLNESSNLEATIFFAAIWSAILISPYLLTRLSEKSKKHFALAMLIIIGFFAFQVINLISST